MKHHFDARRPFSSVNWEETVVFHACRVHCDELCVGCTHTVILTSWFVMELQNRFGSDGWWLCSFQLSIFTNMYHFFFISRHLLCLFLLQCNGRVRLSICLRACVCVSACVCESPDVALPGGRVTWLASHLSTKIPACTAWTMLRKRGFSSVRRSIRPICLVKVDASQSRTSDGTDSDWMSLSSSSVSTNRLGVGGKGGGVIRLFILFEMTPSISVIHIFFIMPIKIQSALLRRVGTDKSISNN